MDDLTKFLRKYERQEKREELEKAIKDKKKKDLEKINSEIECLEKKLNHLRTLKESMK